MSKMTMPLQVARQNHYVPVWYQKGFTLGKHTNYYLDLEPAVRVLSDGRGINPRAATRRSPKSCFWSRDLYSTHFGPHVNDEIERFLFGPIDSSGAKAVRAFSAADQRRMHASFQTFFEYLDAQKLRTPKGLDWLRSRYGDLTQLELMIEMQAIRRMHCTMWFECVREVVSAADSAIKFIVTDHPVTTFNVGLPPTTDTCKYPNDPSIALNGTQTVFALDANNCIILTNLDYAKDPGGTDPISLRRHARFAGSTIARTDSLIRNRKLNKEEVLAVNLLLKARARKYIAAPVKHWMFPEQYSAATWKEIGEVLNPPKNELWHFGGEVLIGYTDGRSGYRDQYGRTSSVHKYHLKSALSDDLNRNDLCGCASGKRFKKCCITVSREDRVPWDERSLRERAGALLNAVVDIVGLDQESSWTEVRQRLSDDHVKRIHEVVKFLWPQEMDLARLLPRPDQRVLRAVYMGLVDPRVISRNVTAWLPYIDEILLLNPFPNPWVLKPEFNPIDSPEKFRDQTLKNIALLLEIAPFLETGEICLVPDPMDVDHSFREMAMSMAELRRDVIRMSEDDLAEHKELAFDEFKRSMYQLSDDAWREMIRRTQPDMNRAQIEGVLGHIRRQQEADPFALMQPVQGGRTEKLQMYRGVSLEVALYIAQLTGSALFTSDNLWWNQLQSFGTRKDDQKAGSAYSRRKEMVNASEWPLTLNPVSAFSVRSSGKLGGVRRRFRKIWELASNASHDRTSDDSVSNLERQLSRASKMTIKKWNKCAKVNGLAIDGYGKLEVAMPASGFEMNHVKRLLLMFGRVGSLSSIPMALRAEYVAASSDTLPAHSS